MCTAAPVAVGVAANTAWSSAAPEVAADTRLLNGCALKSGNRKPFTEVGVYGSRSRYQTAQTLPSWMATDSFVLCSTCSKAASRICRKRMLDLLPLWVWGGCKHCSASQHPTWGSTLPQLPATRRLLKRCPAGCGAEFKGGAGGLVPAMHNSTRVFPDCPGGLLA